MSRLVQTLLIGAAAAFIGSQANAVIVFQGNGRITTPPSGALQTDWNLEGLWGAVTGTPIAPHYFITAQHAHDTDLTLNGVVYTPIKEYDDPGTDLSIYQISSAQSFPSWAPLYTTEDEVGKSLTVFGRGYTRGGELDVSGRPSGWLEGTQDQQLSWGTNTVAATVNGGTGLGRLLYFVFDQSVGGTNAHVSTGDSGGGVFIQQNGLWSLAGVVSLQDGPYNLAPDNDTDDLSSGKNGALAADTDNDGDATFNASVYDARGLWLPSSTGWQQVDPSGTQPVLSGSYASPISSNLPWIQSVLGPEFSVPEPGSMTLLASGLLALAALRIRRRRGIPATGGAPPGTGTP